MDATRVVRPAEGPTAADHVAAPPVEPVVPPDVLAAARRSFLRTGRVEMRALAHEMGIGRATLYRRWTGDRERLLGEVLLSLGLAVLVRAEADVSTRPGAARVCDVHARYLKILRAGEGFRSFLSREPEVAARVLTDPGGLVHRGVAAAWADFLARDEVAGHWRVPLGPPALAGVLTTVTEAFMYADVARGGRLDTVTPTVVVRLMLGLKV